MMRAQSSRRRLREGARRSAGRGCARAPDADDAHVWNLDNRPRLERPQRPRPRRPGGRPLRCHYPKFCRCARIDRPRRTPSRQHPMERRVPLFFDHKRRSNLRERHRLGCHHGPRSWHHRYPFRYCIPVGPDPGEDPTTDDRAQVKLEVKNYRLDFILFSFEVDLTAQAVSRLEP